MLLPIHFGGQIAIRTRFARALELVVRNPGQVGRGKEQIQEDLMDLAIA